MSWTQGFSGTTRDDLASAEPQGLAEQAPDQFDAAIKAAVAIIDSGAVGAPSEHRFNATLSGHSNPGHEPASGYGPDAVTVSVSQAYKESS